MEVILKFKIKTTNKKANIKLLNFGSWCDFCFPSLPTAGALLTVTVALRGDDKLDK